MKSNGECHYRKKLNVRLQKLSFNFANCPNKDLKSGAPACNFAFEPEELKCSPKT